MKPIRFVHTSDVHLDTSFSGSGFPSRLGDRKREAIRATFRRILERARLESVDFVLIAGDLFEHDRVTPDTIEFLKQQFESLRAIRTFIAPGNHDPFIRSSPYREEQWPANVHIFASEEFRSLELPDLGVRITGFGFNQHNLKDHPFATLPVLPSDLFNVVLTHGSDVSRLPAGKLGHGPFTIDEIAGKNVNYCALGHYHRQGPVLNAIDETIAWYSGIPEGRGWDEEGVCSYLMGEIEDRHVRLESRPCNQYPLCTIGINCEGLSSREQILDAILQRRESAFDPNTILRVQLTGSPDPRLELSTAELEERLSGELLHIQWEDRTHPALDYDSLAQEKTLRGRFVRLIEERMASVSEPERLVLERTRLLGVQALLDREVRLR
jgi:DNA repair protein SbcD/Mre11